MHTQASVSPCKSDAGLLVYLLSKLNNTERAQSHFSSVVSAQPMLSAGFVPAYQGNPGPVLGRESTCLPQV